MKQIMHHITDPAPAISGQSDFRLTRSGSPIGRFIFTDWTYGKDVGLKLEDCKDGIVEGFTISGTRRVGLLAKNVETMTFRNIEINNADTGFLMEFPEERPAFERYRELQRQRDADPEKEFNEDILTEMDRLWYLMTDEEQARANARD